MTSLSALHTVGDQIGEAVELHGGGRLSNMHSLGDQINEAAQLSGRKLSRAAIDELTVDMLRMVGFPDPKRALRTYPFELSGGLRQRAMIAMALVCRPALLIADEPTTALDVTIQAQILRLMKDLQAELGMALLMITHDLGVVANVADDVVVMYRGKVVEAGDLHDIFRDPAAPLSQGAAARRAALRHGARRAAGADPRDHRRDRPSPEGEGRRPSRPRPSIPRRRC